MAEEIQLVVFTLNFDDQICEYGVPISKVNEIITIAPPTRMPQTPDFVEGIINLRGKIIPIIDLKKRFEMGKSDLTGESRSVVLEVENQTVGIIVDEVSEVLRLQVQDIEPPPAVIGGITAEYLTGVGKLEERLIILLDMDKIFSEKEKVELATAGQQDN
ncbi:MAG TPA: chemotaxis protein CheW [Syntrophomonadaceae bacterium]|nr:chemotaxis protein CheW [Syntrophomonadaceae bacterium]